MKRRRTRTARVLLLALGVLQLLVPGCRQGRSIALEADTGGAPVSDAVKPNAPADGKPGDTGPTDGGSDTKPVDKEPGGGPLPGTWVTIPPTGTVPVTFSMGSPPSEPCQQDNEDQHQVTLTRAFEISAYEVTQGEFQAVMGYNPSYFTSCGSNCPVERVNWYEAAAYCNALSAKTGLAKCYSCSGTGTSVTCSVAVSYSGVQVYDCPGYRLPTEAEWEYAYRAETTTAYYNGPAICTGCSGFPVDHNADKIGWCCANSGVSYAGCLDLSSDGGASCAGPHPVGQKVPNAWGLYDMPGNVWEWCHDWYTPSLGSSEVTDPWGAASGIYRVWRSGSWSFKGYYMRAASRDGNHPSYGYGSIGFRCARTK